MFKTNYFKIILIFTTLSFSQEINISGTVTDCTGAGIKGAIVELQEEGLTTSTDKNGEFVLSNTVDLKHYSNLSKPHSLLSFRDGGVYAENIKKETKLKIDIYGLNGRLLLSKKRNLIKGNNFIKIPALFSGVNLINLMINNENITFKIINRFFNTYMPFNSSDNSSNLKRNNSTTALIEDVIKVRKEGYIVYKMEINNSDTSNIFIEMINSSGLISDADGNQYQTVKIGSQTWTVENLRTTKYNDGTNISHVSYENAWESINYNTDDAICR